MEWFIGTVDDALTEYQQKEGILIVFVYAENDENSTKLDDLLSSLDVSVFENIPYVAIRIVKESENARQFAQFFPTLTVPVCYILGMNAQPLEVITGLSGVTSDKLLGEFKKAVLLFKEQIGEVKKNVDIPEVKLEDRIEDKKEETVVVEKEEAAPGDAGASADTTTSQEKLEYYRKLLEEKKKSDAKKEEEEKHKKEMERRMDGKAMAELREKQRERELKEAAEERRRQKAEDAQALQRLRDQIKLDKEERAAAAASKNGTAGGGQENVKKAEKKVETVEMNKPVNSDECRIQCRFPDGQTLIKVFPSKELLQVVYDAVNEDVRKPTSFFLMQTYPRKKLTDMNKSLLELGLTPSAVLLVVSDFI